MEIESPSPKNKTLSPKLSSFNKCSSFSILASSFNLYTWNVHILVSDLLTIHSSNSSDFTRNLAREKQCSVFSSKTTFEVIVVLPEVSSE